MWVTVHALSGLALGATAPVGLGLLIVGALSLHVVLDLVPHWDYTGSKRPALWAVVDVVAAVAVVTGLTLGSGLSYPAVVAAVVSALPDLDVLDAVLPGPPRRRLFPSHWESFPHGKARATVGIPIQLVVIAGSVALVVAFS
jgi:hypothetical protein